MKKIGYTTGVFDLFHNDLKPHCDVIYLERTGGISATEIKSSLSTLNKEKILAIKHALDIASIMAEDFK